MRCCYLLALFLAQALLHAEPDCGPTKEACLGAQMAREFERTATQLPSPAVQTFVDQVGQRLAAHLPESDFAFHFRVVTDDDLHPAVEPIALPGGYIYIPAGVLLQCRYEGEFASILAHSIAHVVEWHQHAPASTRIASIPLVFISGAGHSADLVPLSLRDQLRNQELAADQLAIRTLSEAGYDPNALRAYLARVQPYDARLANLRTSGVVRKSESDDAFAAIQDEVRRALPSRTPPSLRRPSEAH